MINSLSTLAINTEYRYIALKSISRIKRVNRFAFLWLIIAFYLNGCATTQTPAPVVDREKPNVTTSATGDLTNQYHIVQKGDTLHSIGTIHGIDAKKLAEWNNIADPRSLRIGQRLNLYIPKKEDSQPTLYALPEQPAQGIPEPTLQSSAVVVVPETPTTVPSGVSTNSVAIVDDSNVKKAPKAVKLPYSEQNLAQLKRGDSPAVSASVSGASSALSTPPPSATASTQPPIERSARIEAAPVASSQKSEKSGHNLSTDWIWPANGKLVSTFSKNSKGLKIAGQAGQPILASASGEVVYSGNGLRGYGNLIIIKHSNMYLSAYAHNSKILVKEGDSVTKGQKIAEMGNTDADTTQLHFEIRKNGKPVDPLIYLPNQP